MKNLKENLYRNTFLIIFICLFFGGCKSVPKFSGNANLCVFVIDENNNPVENFQIHLSGDLRIDTGSTNENGLCVFTSINSGRYILAGEKTGYTVLSDNQIEFTDKGEVYCVQVQSSDYVFDLACDLYSKNEFLEGINELNTIYVDKFNEMAAVISLYKAYGYYKIKDFENANKELKTINKKDKNQLLEKINAEYLYDFLMKEIN